MLGVSGNERGGRGGDEEGDGQRKEVCTELLSGKTVFFPSQLTRFSKGEAAEWKSASTLTPHYLIPFGACNIFNKLLSAGGL